jgi:hypothetical protein
VGKAGPTRRRHCHSISTLITVHKAQFHGNLTLVPSLPSLTRINVNRTRHSLHHGIEKTTLLMASLSAAGTTLQISFVSTKISYTGRSCNYVSTSFRRRVDELSLIKLVRLVIPSILRMCDCSRCRGCLGRRYVILRSHVRYVTQLF